MPSDPAIAAARAIDAMRRGWSVALGEGGQSLRALAIETATDAALAEFDSATRADLLITAGRAETLKLANQREAAAPGRPVLVRREAWHDLPAAIALADPAFDLATPFKGPFRSLPIEDAALYTGALRLAGLAGLLPALFVITGGGADALPLSALDAYEDVSALAIAARARLPVAAAEQAEIVAFRGRADATEHVALVIGAPDGRPPLVRIHSECLTGDVLASLKCDCGPQLHGALGEIATNGWGILLYLRQEGRGIGLINKLRAYALQDQGFDTVDANTRLGFAVDSRDFGVAARMLGLLGQDRVRLLTNNPAKVAELEAAGIAVVERVPNAVASNPHNEKYLATKRDRTGHQL